MHFLGRYQVVGEIARGGMGAVFRGHDPALRRDVAIKVFHTRGGTAEKRQRRFMREVQALSKLHHPHIVSVHDAGVDPHGWPFVVMDFVHGETLESRLKRGGPLRTDDAIDMTRKLAEALEHAHHLGLLHRDVKPSNVLIEADEGEPVLTDFGLVRHLDDSTEGLSLLTQEGAALGTPGYWAPEQALGQRDRVGPPADVYGLGATLYAMLTGDAPSGPTTVAEVMARMREAPEAPSLRGSGIGPELDRVCLRCLAPEPDDRFQTAGELAQALERCLRERRSRRRQSGSGWGTWLVVGGGLLAVGLGGGLGLAMTHRGQDRAETPASPSEAVDGPGDGAGEGSGAEPDPPPAPGLSPEPDRPRPDGSGSKAVEEDEAKARALAAEVRQVEEAEGLEAARTRVQRLLDSGRDLGNRGRTQLYGELARLELELRRPARAQLAATRAIARDGENVTWRLLRVRALIALRESAEANRDLRVAIGLEPELLEARVLAAQVALRTGKLDRAERELKVARRIAPGDLEVATWTVIMLGERKRYEKALVLADARLAEEDHPPLRRERARVLALMGDFGRAKQELERVLEANPEDPSTYYTLGVVLLDQGQFEEAGPHFDRAIELDPDDTMSYVNRSWVRSYSHDYEGALADANRALELDPAVGEGYLNRGLALTNLGRLDEAIRSYQQAVRLIPRHPAVWNNLGQALREQGEHPRALEAFERALRISPTMKPAQYGRAIALVELGRGDEAEPVLREALRVIPADDELFRPTIEEAVRQLERSRSESGS